MQPGDNIMKPPSSSGATSLQTCGLSASTPGGPFKFLAGQYATLGVVHEGARIERAYSLVSSPYEENLEFFLELVPHGALTPHLYKLNEGDKLYCRKIAKGRFTLDLRSGRKYHLCCPPVTGIAPFVSYVRTLYRDWKTATVPCLEITSFFVCRVVAARGSSAIGMKWKKSLRKRLG